MTMSAKYMENLTIIDEILQCIPDCTFDEDDEMKDSTLSVIATVTKENSVKSSEEDADQDTAKDKTDDMNVLTESDIDENNIVKEKETLTCNFSVEPIFSKDDEISSKEAFVQAINLNISPKETTKDHTVEYDSDTATGQLRKESVHFCSPIASYHEYYVSQDTCTQTLSDVDSSDLTLTPDILENNSASFEKKVSCCSKQEDVEGNLTNLMTAAGDCTNSLVIGSVSEISLNDRLVETQLKSELKNVTVGNCSQIDLVDDASNKVGDVLSINVTSKGADVEISFKNSGTDKSLAENEELMTISMDKDLSCTDSSPDLFNTYTDVSSNDSNASEHVSSQDLGGKCNLNENVVSSANKEEVTAYMKERKTKDIGEQTVETSRFDYHNETETAEDVKEIKTDLADNAYNDVTECFNCKGTEQLYKQGTEISQTSDLEWDGDEERISEYKMCDSSASCKHVQNPDKCTKSNSSQDLFQDMENGSGSDSDDIKHVHDSSGKPLQQVKFAADLLYCNETIETKDISLLDESCSNKRETSSPDLYTQPLKKLKTSSDADIQDTRSLKRSVPALENVEETVSPKKLRLSTDDTNEDILEITVFHPKTLKCLAAENLDCLKEEVVWRRNIDQKSKGTAPAIPFERHFDLNLVTKQLDTQEESVVKSADQYAHAEEITVEAEHNSVGTIEADNHKINVNVHPREGETNKQIDTVITVETEVEVQNDNLKTETSDCQRVNNVIKIGDIEIKETYLNVGDENVSMASTESLDAEEITHEDKDDVCDLKFMSATEYLSQSSQGSSTGFTYDKNNSPEYLCQSQEFLSVSGDAQPSEGRQCSEICPEGSGTIDTAYISHPTVVTVELAADPCTDIEVDTETLDIIVSRAVDHLVPDHDEIPAEEDIENPDGCSMFDKSEGDKGKYYSCDIDLCDDDGKPVCPPVDKRGDTDVPSSSTSCFKWRYAPSCDTDVPVSEVDMEETIVKITPIQTCHKPLRLGLSKKRQPLHRLHKL